MQLKILLVSVCIMVVYSCGCVTNSNHREEDENTNYGWIYTVGINNPKNIYFNIFLPIPIWMNNTYVDIINNTIRSEGIVSIKTVHTPYGQAINISSNNSIYLSAHQIMFRDRESELMTLSLCPYVDYNNLTQHDWRIDQLMIYSKCAEAFNKPPVGNLEVSFKFIYELKYKWNDSFLDTTNVYSLNARIPLTGEWIEKNCTLWAC